jgi:hypothetical protein
MFALFDPAQDTVRRQTLPIFRARDTTKTVKRFFTNCVPRLLIPCNGSYAVLGTRLPFSFTSIFGMASGLPLIARIKAQASLNCNFVEVGGYTAVYFVYSGVSPICIATIYSRRMN